MAGLFTGAAATNAKANSLDARKQSVSVAQRCPGRVQGVYYYRGMTRKWQIKVNVTPSKSVFNASLVKSCRYTVWVARLWQKRASKWHDKYDEYVKRQNARSISGYAPLCGSSCVYCESKYDPNAWNGDDYWGWYQFDYSTWTHHGGIASHWGKSTTSSGEQTMIARNVTYDAWPNC